MSYIRLLLVAISLTFGVYAIQSVTAQPVMAADEYDHSHEAHEEDDPHEHEHDEHEEDHEDEASEHGDEGHGHEEHGHGEHEEGRTEINPDAAAQAGIQTAKAGPASIQDILTLTGRIMLNRNTTAEVRARFPGIVQNVKVNWGEKVQKGQPLATIEANESLRVYTVDAPIDGVVLTRNTNIGNVAGEEPLFTIADLSEVWAEFHVFPRDLGKVQEDQQVRVHTIDGGKEIEAPITLILPTADPLSQTVIAVVSIPNQGSQWRPGMTVEGDVHIAETQVPVAVTAEAVQRQEDKHVIYVQEGDAYEMRPVTLGKSDGKYVEVHEGLKAGETYVSQGSFIVKADLGKSQAEHAH